MLLDCEARVRVACLLGELPPWLPAFEENAVLVSDRLVRDDRLTSAPACQRRLLVRDTGLGKEELTRDVPGLAASLLRHLDRRGLVRPGAVIHRGEVLAGLVYPLSKSELS